MLHLVVVRKEKKRKEKKRKRNINNNLAVLPSHDIELFENISLAAKPRIIRASPKSDMAIIWFDIWDT